MTASELQTLFDTLSPVGWRVFRYVDDSPDAEEAMEWLTPHVRVLGADGGWFTITMDTLDPTIVPMVDISEPEVVRSGADGHLIQAACHLGSIKFSTLTLTKSHEREIRRIRRTPSAA